MSAGDYPNHCVRAHAQHIQIQTHDENTTYCDFGLLLTSSTQNVCVRLYVSIWCKHYTEAEAAAEQEYINTRAAHKHMWLRARITHTQNTHSNRRAQVLRTRVGVCWKCVCLELGEPAARRTSQSALIYCGKIGFSHLRRRRRRRRLHVSVPPMT